jgi:hypothetical protein
MTIYDADYLAETGQKTGVTDTVAEGQATEPFYAEDSLKDNEDHNASASNMVQEVSEKELNFKALRDSIAQEKQEREAERLRYQQELENMRYQMQQMNSQKEELSDPLDGLESGDILTVEKFRQAQQVQQQRYEQEIANLRYENLENRARLKHSDYNEVMEKYSIPLLKNDPDFASGFRNAADPAEYAYKIGRMMMVSEQQRQPEPQISRDAQRLVENARKPSTLSNVRGGQQAISTAEYYENMSDKDFAALVKRNMERLL